MIAKEYLMTDDPEEGKRLCIQSMLALEEEISKMKRLIDTLEEEKEVHLELIKMFQRMIDDPL